jgi:hypothetical protein
MRPALVFAELTNTSGGVVRHALRAAVKALMFT